MNQVIVSILIKCESLTFSNPSLCRAPVSAGKGEASRSSSSLSVQDVLRQRYSVTWHPRLLYLIVSDGYMATVMRVLDKPSANLILKTLLKDTSTDLEKASRILDKSQVVNQGLLEVSSSVFACTFCRTILDNIVSSHSVFSDSCEGMVGVPFLSQPRQQPYYAWAQHYRLGPFSSHGWILFATFPAGSGDVGWYQGTS